MALVAAKFRPWSVDSQDGRRACNPAVKQMLRNPHFLFFNQNMRCPQQYTEIFPLYLGFSLYLLNYFPPLTIMTNPAILPPTQKERSGRPLIFVVVQQYHCGIQRNYFTAYGILLHELLVVAVLFTQSNIVTMKGQ